MVNLPNSHLLSDIIFRTPALPATFPCSSKLTKLSVKNPSQNFVSLLIQAWIALFSSATSASLVGAAAADFAALVFAAAFVALPDGGVEQAVKKIATITSEKSGAIFFIKISPYAKLFGIEKRPRPSASGALATWLFCVVLTPPLSVVKLYSP